MVHPIHAALRERPQALNRVRMDIPANVHLLRVVDAAVVVSRFPKPILVAQFVRVGGDLLQKSVLSIIRWEWHS